MSKTRSRRLSHRSDAGMFFKGFVAMVIAEGQTAPCSAHRPPRYSGSIPAIKPSFKTLFLNQKKKMFRVIGEYRFSERL